MTTNDLLAMRRQIEDELTGDILEFWMKYAVDQEHGGFFGYISKNLEADRDAARGAVLYTRILWAFSAAYGKYHDPRYLGMADRALGTIASYFLDGAHGGVFWMTDPMGRPADTKKQTYAQAFAIYALAEHHLSTGSADSLALAKDLYRTVESHCRAVGALGYAEALSRDWKPLEDVSLSPKDLNAARTMNTHLHLLEAYTRLYVAWKDNALRMSLATLLGVMLDHVLHGDSFGMFFDEQWTKLTSTVSFGHDIEGSWLICEAAEALGDAEMLDRARAAAVKMAGQVAKGGVDRVHGGVCNECGEEGLDDDKVWWVQAEAVVGFLNAYEISGDARFLDEAHGAWRFLADHIIDRTYGEWVWQTAADGTAGPPDEKAGPWKCPYHNTRMCLQAMERIDRLTKG